MARARNIKPGFFTNDTLAELDPLARLLFVGIWTIADRAGRLEDRPKRIKAEVLPYDSCDVDSMLSELERLGFIQRYEAGGIRAIQVVNWDKHQNPHMKEAESTIPAPCLSSASPVQTSDEQSPSTERAGLIPDSLNLIPDSIEENPTGSSSPAEPTTCPHRAILALFGKHLPNLPQPKPELWDGQRQKNLAARWRWLLTARKTSGERYATSEAEGLDWFERFFGYVAKSDFLTGRSGDWQCDLGWLVKAENFTKVIQGNYENKEVTA